MGKSKTHRRQRNTPVAGKRRRRRRGRYTLHYILLTIFVIAAGVTLSLTVFFKIEAVNVVGNTKYTKEDIVKTSAIIIEENLFRIDYEKAKVNILEKYSYIKSVEISPKMPSSIQITIIEEQASASLEDTNGKYILINAQGKVLEQNLDKAKDGVPKVKGIVTSKAEPGKHLGEEAADGITKLRYLIESIEESEFDGITSIDMSDRLNMKIIYEDRLLIELGTPSELTYKLKFVKTVIEDEISETEEGFIDVTNASSKRIYYLPGKIQT